MLICFEILKREINNNSGKINLFTMKHMCVAEDITLKTAWISFNSKLWVMDLFVCS